MECSASYKVKGGKLIKVRLVKENGIITSTKIFGDFFIHPEESIETLEESLKNVTISDAENKIYEFFKSVDLVGANPEDFVNTVKLAYYK
ncbi:MAG: lipoate protein ligase C-terminal domain-containing protein [Thermoplasmata archaeon]